jgi:hypothetical protein
MGDRRAARGLLTARLKDAAESATWTLALYAIVTAIGQALETHRAAKLAVQAFVVEWGAGRLGVAWSDPTLPVPDAAALARRAGRGALWGTAAAVFTLLFLRATGAGTFTGLVFVPSELIIAVAVAVFSAVRDELLLRGLVLRVFHHTLTPTLRVVTSGVVAAAARLGEVPSAECSTGRTSSAGVATLLVAGLGGACLAGVWLLDRGAWMPIGAHAAWALVTTTMLSGGLTGFAFRTNAWGGGGFEGSLATVAALAVIASAFATSRYRTGGGKE